MLNYRAIAGLLLRVSLGGLFLYFGLQALLEPNVALSYIPSYVDFLATNTFITIWGVIEIIIGLMLVLGVFTKWAAFAAAALLVPIIISLGLNEVAYRDIVILFAALRLAYEPSHALSLTE